MGEDWESVKARLEEFAALRANYGPGFPCEVNLSAERVADIRAALERVEMLDAEIAGRQLAERVISALRQRVEELERDRDNFALGRLAAQERSEAAEAEVTEWRDTARSEMAGRRAAEAEVERLRAEMIFDEENETRIVTALEAEVARLRAAIVYLIKVREVVCQHEPYEGSEQTCAKCKADAALAPEVKPEGSACADRAETVEQTHARWSASSEGK